MEFMESISSSSAMKEAFRQYNTTVKNEPSDNLFKNLSQSSNLPLEKMYRAFNSSGNLNRIDFQKFKDSQARSIIEKLMQPNEPNPSGKVLDQEAIIFNELNHIDIGNQATVRSISLSETELKIFREVVNLLDQIQEINTEAQTQHQDFQSLKAQMLEVGIELPEFKESPSRAAVKLSSLTSEELENIFDQNEAMEQQIAEITKKISSRGQGSNLREALQRLIEKNEGLKKELQQVKQQIYSTGEIPKSQFEDAENRIRQLQVQIQVLSAQRIDKLSEKDERVRQLKRENERIRQKTKAILSKHDSSQSGNSRKSELIRELNREEQRRNEFKYEINILKERYRRLKDENQRINQRRNSHNEYLHSGLQVESKVRPFQSAELRRGLLSQTYRNSSRREQYEGKQNFYENFVPARYSNELQINTKGQDFGMGSHSIKAEAHSFGNLGQYEDVISQMRGLQY